MLADQQAGRLARSDKVLMCGAIKGRTTDCILEADPLEGPLVPDRKLSGAVFCSCELLSC